MKECLGNNRVPHFRHYVNQLFPGLVNILGWLIEPAFAFMNLFLKVAFYDG